MYECTTGGWSFIGPLAATNRLAVSHVDFLKHELRETPGARGMLYYETLFEKQSAAEQKRLEEKAELSTRGK